NITYANPSVIEMLRKYEDKFRMKWPGFSVDDLIGKNIDTFHKKPSNQRRILGNVNQLPHRTEIKVGELEFGLNATALFDASGNQIGNAVEWKDLNARAVYRNEVNRVISALKNGDLSVRGDLAILDDVYGKMMQGINEVIDSILEPISELQQRLPKIADGDLTAYVTGEYMGDHALLKNSLNATLDSLNSILTQVAVAVDQISSGSLQVSDSSQSLSQGATEQASSLEEISASMNQLTAQTRQNAENAAQANKLAAGARDFANTGNRQMGDMLNAMDEINKSSTQISKIIKAIDEIAFQTNLLALNAAVEAARAGVHGKGFAVVAEEVRNLAQRSAKAAKETTELIEDSIKRVQNGTNIANETAGALGEIVNQVTKVTDLVGEIDVASKEQAQGIGQINEGLSQIDKVTQSNTASAEETAASAEELSGQSSRLKEMLGKFKLKTEEQEAWNGQLPNGITPELLMQMLRQLQSQGLNPFQSQPVKKSAPETAWGSAPVKRNAPSKLSSGKSVDPSSVISLDDDDFGKF
ncbi:MAG: methyl-accepting chemotaxis protein, partial [Calditrichaeota bacterium]|nr:methyl-accepting chemotaxis protein [Calditrichota bacterium]